MLVPLIGYAPDEKSTKPGVLVDCAAMIPTLKGMAAAPSAVSSGYTLAAACRGAALLHELDGTTRFIAGSAAKLYEGSGGSFTDQTRASGGDYALTGEYRWRFAQFGAVTLAAAKTDILQRSTSGAFVNLSTSPALKAALIETVENFVMVADTNETTYGDSPDRWWCSALRDETDFTPSVNTQCATNTLVGAPGRILGLKRFGERIIAYKLRSMFLGTYVGQPTVWEWPQVPGAVGALSHEAIVDVGTADFPVHCFMGEDDFYIFDGSRPRSIGTNAVKDKVFNEMLRTRQGTVIGQHDSKNSLVRWYYPVTDSVNPDRCVVWHYRTGRWGRDDRQVEIALTWTDPGLTYDQLGSSYGTYADLPDAPFDSGFASASSINAAYFDTSHVLKTLTGTPSSSSITTGDFGDDGNFTNINRVRPRYITSPDAASLTNYYRNNLWDALITDAGASMTSGKFDFQRDARWHRFLIRQNGACEIEGLNIYGDPQGEE